MQRIIIDEPYEFIPPHRGTILARLMKRFLIPRMLARDYGVVEVECRDAGRLRASLDAGHGVLLTPNHCRPCDALALVKLSDEARSLFYIVASWHLFKQGWLQSFIVRRMGAFSIYREGMDRAAVKCSMEILKQRERPLVIFPEGAVSRTNDRLSPLMEGTAFIARSAARKRAAGDGGKVVVHPVAMRYQFLGNVGATLKPVIEEIETRLSWRPQKQLDLFERISKIGRALLGLKEVEFFGETQPGSLFERTAGLIDRLLCPLEEEWLKGPQQGSVVGRVKKLRSAILRDMVSGDIDDAERDRRWRQFADLYLAQQVSLYPENYLHPDAPPERFLETVERFEEDLTDAARPHPPMKVTLQVCEAIEVSPDRDRSADVDPLMARIEEALSGGLALAEKIPS